jgi:hypothetical protein
VGDLKGMETPQYKKKARRKSDHHRIKDPLNIHHVGKSFKYLGMMQEKANRHVGRGQEGHF